MGRTCEKQETKTKAKPRALNARKKDLSYRGAAGEGGRSFLETDQW